MFQAAGIEAETMSYKGSCTNAQFLTDRGVANSLAGPNWRGRRMGSLVSDLG